MYDSSTGLGRSLDKEKLKKATPEELNKMKDEIGDSEFYVDKESNLKKITSELSNRNIQPTTNEEKISNIQNQVINHKMNNKKGAENVVSQTNLINTDNNRSSNSVNYIPLTSARNPDSTIQRLSERFMTFSHA